MRTRVAIAALACCSSALAQQSRGIVVDHFATEAAYIARELQLDIGSEQTFSNGWATRGTPAQMDNKLRVGQMVYYCARVAASEVPDIPESIRDYPSQARAAQQSYDAALKAAWRLCSDAEIGAYRRMLIEGRYANADRTVIQDCSKIPSADSYAAVERCIRAEIASRR